MTRTTIENPTMNQAPHEKFLTQNDIEKYFVKERNKRHGHHGTETCEDQKRSEPLTWRILSIIPGQAEAERPPVLNCSFLSAVMTNSE